MAHLSISQNRYKIRSKIGEGGMGSVFLAFDQQLKRDVAIKVINEKFADNRIYWSRFEKEARAISALNHPNILTIHDIGREDRTLFLVTEFVQGTTLRNQIRNHGVTISTAIDYAIQVADALAAAHAAGIIHRDIKPENIMVRADGYLKVLDFGLAKLAEVVNQGQQHSGTGLAEASTVSLQTDPASAVGTIGYMSPEQLRGIDVDARTDIWALGVVLYEMIAHQAPFDRPTKSDQIAAVLEHEPVPLTNVADDVPQELERVVTRALSKEKNARYQTAASIRDDLKTLKHRLEFKKSFESEPAQTGKKLSFATEAIATETDGTKTKLIPTNYEKRKWQKVGRTLVIAFLCGTIAGIYFAYRLVRQRWLTTKPFSNTEVVNLTNNGKSNMGVVSPDGKYIAHVTEDGDNQTLMIRSLTTGTSVVAAAAGKVTYQGLTFSNDSDYVYYVRYENSDVGNLYQVTVIGAKPTKILDRVDSPITFSPDGRRFAFVRFIREQDAYLLLTANANGTDEKVIAQRRSGERLSLNGPAWSPDGKRILCAAGSWTGGYHMNLFEVQLSDGSERAIGSGTWFTVLQVAWRNDNSILVNGSVQPMAPLQIWEVSYPEAKSERLTNDSSDYLGVSISRDHKTMVTVQNNRQKSIWVSRLGQSEETRVATTVGSTYGLAWAPGNRIVFSSMTGSNLDISVIKADGSGRAQLTVNVADNYHPAVSPDGRYIVFSSSRTGSFNLWRMDLADGSNPKQLTSGGSDFNPSITPDSRFIIYEHQATGSTLWKVAIDGGEPHQLTSKYAAVPAVSPDGRHIACRYYIAPDLKGIAVLPIEGGQPVKQLPIAIIDWQRVHWTADGTALTYVDSRGNDYNLWIVPLNGAPAKQLTNFKGEQIFSYDWSSDSTQLISERGTEISDVLAIKFLS